MLNIKRVMLLELIIRCVIDFKVNRVLYCSSKYGDIEVENMVDILIITL